MFKAKFFKLSVLFFGIASLMLFYINCSKNLFVSNSFSIDKTSLNNAVGGASQTVPVSQPVSTPVKTPANTVLNPISGSAQMIYESSTGITVPSDFGCYHDTGFVENWPKLGGSDLYYGPDFNFLVKANTVRLYGMGGLEWNTTEKSDGQFDWNYWDRAFAKLRRSGVKKAIYNPYNVPDYLNVRGAEGGRWQMQKVPYEKLKRWLSLITNRYPEIKIIEVANEVFAPGIADGFWKGSEQELVEHANMILDWRNESGWNGQVWSPSIPGFLGNNQPFINWLKNYPRSREFDAISIHLYYLTAQNLGQAASELTHWTNFIEVREGLKSIGLNKPLVDGEKGFGPGVVVPGTMYNYGVKAILEGIQQVCFFQLSSYGQDETNLGQPWKNDWAKKDIQDLAELAGKKITKVRTNNSGRFEVTITD